VSEPHSEKSNTEPKKKKRERRELKSTIAPDPMDRTEANFGEEQVQGKGGWWGGRPTGMGKDKRTRQYQRSCQKREGHRFVF